MCQYTILNLADSKEQRKTEWLWKRKKTVRVHIAGLGDVGGTVLTGLFLKGGEYIEEIGIYDLNRNLSARWEMELNQVAVPFQEHTHPVVYALEEEELFACDVFVFCIARNVPAVGKEDTDVRMAQFRGNAAIMETYAKAAADCHYRGLFLVVSDPVDLLCKSALLASADGKYPLFPEQIQGCGLGVMNGRAIYYAKKYPEFAIYLKEGRVYGPHGKQLVVADSIVPENYDDVNSRRLTDLVVNANLEMRKLGYKPYIAPALSSAVYTILLIIQGEWNYSACYLDGVYFGAKNRRTGSGTEWESTTLPEALYERIKNAYESLKVIL